MSEYVLVKRELLERLVNADYSYGALGTPNYGYPALDELRAVLAHEAGPVVERQPVARPTGLSQGWNLTRSRDGFVIGHQSKAPDAIAIERAVRDGYVWVPFLISVPPAPVAVVMPERRVQPNGFTGKGWAELRGWNACLDKVKELNQ